ncbi:hypothetical protein ASE69_00115 [Sphingomonas sp. Leaf208]|uniref:amidohydrolase family protein n=1 Tax=Sphingomonas sp. Leaf208 TaxID=1735679 RepID=UPI000701A451|nr:hypothetical protein ASE69_00115 [Sphingomonas sp. Leaf208]
MVDAGFEDRVMFGTDELIWPGLMRYSVGIIQNADYLSSEQKRDILYNNAARFLWLAPVNRTGRTTGNRSRSRRYLNSIIGDVPNVASRSRPRSRHGRRACLARRPCP